MSRLSLHLFGAPRIHLDGATVSTDRRKAIALLAYLAVTGRHHTRDRLAALFWPDYETAAAYLRRTLWEIRAMVGAAWLDAGREQVALTPGAPLWVDVVEFRRLGASLHTPADPQSLRDLAAAAELYQGDFMAGFSLRDSTAFEDWQRFECETLRREAATVLQHIAESYRRQGHAPSALDAAHRWLALDPLQEGAHCLLMRLYAEAGDRAAALRQYEQCVQIMQRELDALPDASTTALYEEIRQGRLRLPPLPPASMPTAPPSILPALADSTPAADPFVIDLPRHNLPSPATRFVGRAAELESIAELLSDPGVRVITLVGPGGVGKTRLALQTAWNVAGRYEDGAWFVSLAPLNTAEQMVPAIARTLGVSLSEDGGGPREQLHTFLCCRRLLLVMDNAEHIVTGGGAALIAEIALRAPGVTVLVTSRVRLGLAGEQLFLVLGLGFATDLPGAPQRNLGNATVDMTGAGMSNGKKAARTKANGSDGAVTLFEQRAQSLQPHFHVGAANRRAIERICSLVQGFPLGIELAAAWVEVLSPSEIGDEIEKSADFLEGEIGDERQRSIRGVFDSTWRLLTPAEQDAFRSLSIFRGPFTRAAAEATAATGLRMLLMLSHKSLIYRVSDESYALHELLRQFAEEQLRADSDDWRATHHRMTAYYADWLQQQKALMQGPHQREAYDAIGGEINNVRTALLWAVEQRREGDASVILDALLIYYSVRTWREEFESLLKSALALVPEDEAEDIELAALRARITGALACYSDFNWIMSDPIPFSLLLVGYFPVANAKIVAREGIALAQRRAVRERMGLALPALAHTWFFLGNTGEGLALLYEGLEIAREKGNEGDVGFVLYLLAGALGALARVDEAEGLCAEALASARRRGDRMQTARCLLLISLLRRQRRDEFDSRPDLREAMETFVATGALMEAARVLGALGDSSDSAGDYAATIDYYAEARSIVAPLHDLNSDHSLLSWEGLAALRLGRIDHARDCRNRAMALAQAVHDPFLIAWNHWELGDIERVAGNLDETRTHWDEAFHLFTSLQLLNGLNFSHRGFGELAWLDGNLDLARAEFAQSEQLARADKHLWSVTYALSGLARVDTACGLFDQAGAEVEEALALAEQTDQLGLLMIVLYHAANLAMARGEVQRAATLSVAVLSQPSTWIEYRRMAEDLYAKSAALLDDEECRLLAEHASGLPWRQLVELAHSRTVNEESRSASS